MKQLFKNKDGIRVHEVPLPTPGNNELLVAVEASVISTGTETIGLRQSDESLIEKIQKKKLLLDRVKQKIDENGLGQTITTIRRKLNPAEQSQILSPIGYSNAGRIVAKGNMVKGFNVGDRVACAGAGIATHAEYVTIPINLAVKLANNVSFKAGAFTTIGSIAMQGIRRAQVTFGETIVISGLGLLGLFAVQIAKAWGLVVIGIDINVDRLEMAKSFGADYCFKADDNKTDQAIHDLTNGNGADAVIIYAATKSSEPANQALRLCRKKGRVVVVGSIGMDLQREDMYLKELDFVISTSYGPGRYDSLYELKGIDYPIGYVRWTENRNMMEFVRLISDGAINIEEMISNTFTIDQVSEAYESLIKEASQNISSVFIYHHETDIKSDNKIELYPRPIPSDKIKVGIIGAGGFIQANHLPNLLKLPKDYELIAIANRTPAEAKSSGEKYKTRYITTNYNEILKDPEIDLVVIGTRHNLHAKQVVDAIKAGKHVLVEKPLAMNNQELKMVQDAIELNSNVHVTVGFNRRYSPLTQKVKQIIRKSSGPMIINYRINAGYIPSETWIQDLEEGGGRIIGELCHFIDYISYLTDSEVLKVQASHIPVDGVKIKAEDNLIIQVSYSDGSLGVITYVSIGGKDLPKERIEVFINNSSMLIDDFKSLLMYNVGEKDIQLKEFDKGHYNEIIELSKLIQGKESLILPFKKDYESTAITLSIIDQIHNCRNE